MPFVLSVYVDSRRMHPKIRPTGVRGRGGATLLRTHKVTVGSHIHTPREV